MILSLKLKGRVRTTAALPKYEAAPQRKGRGGSGAEERVERRGNGEEERMRVGEKSRKKGGM